MKEKIDATDAERSTLGSGDVTKARDELASKSATLSATDAELAGFEKQLKKLTTAMINAEDVFYDTANGGTPEQEAAI